MRWYVPIVIAVIAVAIVLVFAMRTQQSPGTNVGETPILPAEQIINGPRSVVIPVSVSPNYFAPNLINASINDTITLRLKGVLSPVELGWSDENHFTLNPGETKDYPVQFRGAGTGLLTCYSGCDAKRSLAVVVS